MRSGATSAPTWAATTGRSDRPSNTPASDRRRRRGRVQRPRRLRLCPFAFDGPRACHRATRLPSDPRARGPGSAEPHRDRPDGARSGLVSVARAEAAVQDRTRQEERGATGEGGSGQVRSGVGQRGRRRVHADRYGLVPGSWCALGGFEGVTCRGTWGRGSPPPLTAWFPMVGLPTPTTFTLFPATFTGRWTGSCTLLPESTPVNPWRDRSRRPHPTTARCGRRPWSPRRPCSRRRCPPPG